MFFVSINDYMYDELFCAYKYNTLIWIFKKGNSEI
jgi:hypothetical protein